MSDSVQLSPAEISSLLRERIRRFEAGVDEREVGTVVSVADGIVKIYGLSGVHYGEMLEFQGGVAGLALNLERDAIGAVVLGNYEQLTEGQEVRATGRILEVPVGPDLFGRVVDPLGRPLDGGSSIPETLRAPIEKVAPGVITRQSVSQPVQTGLKAIDAMVPIGRGQRELIIGDRQTGKTALAIDTIINQRHTDLICVYVAIGQKASSVSQVVRKLEEHDVLKRTIVVAATAAESAALQFIAPYAGCTMGAIRGLLPCCRISRTCRSTKVTRTSAALCIRPGTPLVARRASQMPIPHISRPSVHETMAVSRWMAMNPWPTDQ